MLKVPGGRFAVKKFHDPRQFGVLSRFADTNGHFSNYCFPVVTSYCFS
jgi:hypothetical protein